MPKAENCIEGRVELSVSANKVEQPAVTRLRFTGQRDFRKTLNERVNAYLRDNHIPARDVPAMYVKTAIMLAWWLGAYLLLLLGHFPPLVNVVLCVVWAMAIAAVGFNVMHDANHNGYSDHPRVNKLVSLSAEILGMSGFRWRTKHNVWHHTYTNIAGFDDDVETFGLMRLTPREPWKPLFKAQAWYFPVIYSFIALRLHPARFYDGAGRQVRRQPRLPEDEHGGQGHVLGRQAVLLHASCWRCRCWSSPGGRCCSAS